MIENRRHFRLRDYFDVQWNIKDSQNTGEGTVLNISASGALLQTNSPLKPFDRCVIEIQAPTGGALPFGSKKAKIVWFRRLNEHSPKYQCGIEFLKDAGIVDPTLRAWLDQKLADLSEAANVNILNNYVV